MINVLTVGFAFWYAGKKVESEICRPTNKFTHVFAPPGTGKTTLAAKIVRLNLKRNRTTYSNVKINGAYEFELKDLGKTQFENCTLIIDEAGQEGFSSMTS